MDRVDCHCGWAQMTTSRAASSNLLHRHHVEVHGLGTPDFYRPSPWSTPDSNPMPRIHLWSRRRAA